VARLDKTTGQNQQTWPMPALPNTVRAWAFAQWGGRFWIFVSTEDVFSGRVDSQVYRLDPTTGAADPVLSNLPSMIVGAGVSTCAPSELD